MPLFCRVVTRLVAMVALTLVTACADNPTTPSCTYALTPAAHDVAAGGGRFEAMLTTASSCAWSATAGAPWVTVETPRGTGPGAVVFQVAANDGTGARASALTVQGQGLEIRQAAPPATLNCSFAVSPPSVSFGASGGAAPLVVAAPGGCRWTATTQDAWLSLAGASGDGSGPMIVSAAPNPGATTRTGTVALGDQRVSVTQAGAGCDFDVSPASRSIGAAGGRFDVSIGAADTCDWQAVASDRWLTVSPARGTGPGRVSVDVAAHTGTSGRTGTLRIAGETVTVTQSATAACPSSVSPQTEVAPAAGGSFIANVTGAANCAWTATSTAAWITIVLGQSGTGSGPVGYLVAANTSTVPRTATVQIGAESVTVTQQGAPPPCTYTVSPTAQQVPRTGGAFQVAVSSGGTCQWRATTNVTWLTITSGAQGTGAGTVGYSVSANTTQVVRRATLTIAGQTVVVTQAAQ